MAVETSYALVLALVLLCGAAYWKRVLTLGGAIVAFFMGAIISLFGGYMWLLLLLLFFMTSFAATKYKFSLKEKMGVQEARGGARGAENVLANGIIPTLIALISCIDLPFMYKWQWGILFITSIGAAAADTIASELGVLSKRTYLITTRERVRAGVDGGISLQGEIWAAIAASYTALVGYIVFSLPMEPTFPESTKFCMAVSLPIIFGFIGCNIDSVFGATLERIGLLNKHTNNMLSIAIIIISTWTALMWLS